MKMDKHLIAAEQEHEMDYLTKKLSCTRAQIREAIEKVGNSRRKVYEYIRKNFTNEHPEEVQLP